MESLFQRFLTALVVRSSETAAPQGAQVVKKAQRTVLVLDVVSDFNFPGSHLSYLLTSVDNI